MSQKYYAIVTNLGAAKIANAAALGTKLSITQMAVGDGSGTLPTPNASQTRLVNETRRAAINTLSIDPANTSQVIAEQVIPETEGGFWIREMGLFDADGTLIAVCNTPETYKPALQEGSGRTQTVRMILIVNSTEAITLKIDPSVVLATRQYVDDRMLEVRQYADGLMDAHLKAANPHTQYAPVNSPTLTGTPKAPTAAPGTNSTQLASTAFVQAAIAALAGGAPEALDTLKELADALGGDANFSTTVLNRLAGKMDIAKNGSDIASVSDFLNNLGLGSGSALPVGVPVPWPLATPPVGWFRCNGATFSATAYPQLAKAYPTLKLPDLRGEFIRGWDGGRNVDAGRELLSWQKGSYLLQEALANVDRVVQFSVNDIGLLGWDATENNGDAPRARSTADSGISTWNATARGGTGMQYLGYSRPRNIAFNYIVRAA
ncbi:phage tail protein [Pantoea ananatis]|uniref:phage tail protein n=1 Tax=Pantoea ananas TaxID=553 RepID=UPI0025CA11FA|nr:phage tail protein [Pantoea ananatis]MDN4127267.1 phage tail protein [Pantoea ananatis]MDN4150938.1 phage tail protein [Pantoea ananatis]